MNLEYKAKAKEPKKSKTLLVLSLYHSLKAGGVVVKEEWSAENDVSTRAFDRYISDIRTFLAEEECDVELVFDREHGGYRMRQVLI